MNRFLTLPSHPPALELFRPLAKESKGCPGQTPFPLAREGKGCAEGGLSAGLLKGYNLPMTEAELHRVIQYITGQLSYGLPVTSEVIRTGFGELAELAKTATTKANRESILGYICAYTVKKTGQPEILVREILEAGARWLDEISETLERHEPESVN